ncbi:High affinity cAMP-specific and IBMX-insensitive 3',5'-cyclic phosphodiesterase 9A [Haplosporangium sp. Z 767]|nr:High affinity cAMP-specific and IBMX-insensitive 3',5'-cyclic phosphodiesterase 9A [Haplosporangium sp. Z 11]KAF9176840.1 High affinity cAMP-specific and IBMX-insensitive 3',5'-cyclic phosphodiesterase 9A [Haplosporangium sp. Z 767]
MLKFMSGKYNPAGLDFNVWDHSLPEIYGIILGMFVKLGLVECLNISEGELLDFIIDVDRGYLATFYHSFYHAADVTAVLFHMLLHMNASQYLSKPDMAALLLAGLCHDIGHPGLNNLFQVNAKTELAKEFGETSVLEKYSCSLAMELVAKHKLFRNIATSPSAILPEGNRVTEDGMKEAMIKAIMATDMSVHYDMLNNLNTLIECTSSASSTPTCSDNESTENESETESDSTPSSPTQSHAKLDAITVSHVVAEATMHESLRSRFQCPVSNHHGHHHHRRQLSTSSSVSDCSDVSATSDASSQTTQSIQGMRSPLDLTPELRQSLCNCLLHAADISNAVKPWALCKRWSDLVVQEFFRQGDIEKAQGLPASPNMDRDQHSQPQISLGFGDFVVQPYFESFVELLPEASPFLANLTNNRAKWVELQKAARQAEENTNQKVNTAVDNAVGANGEIQRTGSPLLAHLTPGRRVSVAAGVLVLDDIRPHRPPHRRQRHSTNAELSHGHVIRKIKRSLSGRSLSTCLRDLQNHPRCLQSLSKAIQTQDGIASVLKREAALAGKDSSVKLSGSTVDSANLSAHHCMLDGSLESAPLAPQSSQPLQEKRQQSCAHTSLPKSTESTNLMIPAEFLDPIAAQYRQRRHGSLQLENRYPSIRQEYGNGYIDLYDQEMWDPCDNDAEYIPLNHFHSASSVSPSSPHPTVVVPLSQTVPIHNATLFHSGQTPEHKQQVPVHKLQRQTLASHPVSSRNSSSIVTSDHAQQDRRRSIGIFGANESHSDQLGKEPLDASPERRGMSLKAAAAAAKAAPLVMVSTAAGVSANGPPSPTILGASEGQTAKRHADSLLSSPLTLAMTESVPSEDGPLGCVVGMSLSSNDLHNKVSLDGTVNIAAATSTGPL